MVFETSAAYATPIERMRIDSAGNVGIGTTSPTQAKLVVNTTSLVASAFGRDGTDGDVVQFDQTRLYR